MIDGNISADLLEDYALAPGVTVEVELLGYAVAGAVPAGPRVAEGEVLYATGRVLVLANRYGGGKTRVPWHAIALIRAATPTHPATT